MVQVTAPYILHEWFPCENWVDNLFSPDNEETERQGIQIFQE